MSTPVSDDLQTRFRHAMAHLCAPVTIITAMDDRRPHGTTVSAVMSLSVEPLLVAVALAQTSDTLALIETSRRFGVNVLASHQHPIALRFATKGEDKFAEVGWQPSGEVPRIDETAVWLSCELESLLPGGDHTIVVGRVHTADTNTDAEPLTYHRRSFGTHAAHD